MITLPSTLETDQMVETDLLTTSLYIQHDSNKLSEDKHTQQSPATRKSGPILCSSPPTSDGMADYNSREHIAWDIETTGFAWDDRITVSGFWYPDGFADIIVNTGGEDFDASACEDRLTSQTGGIDVSIWPVEDEAKLLKRLHQTVFDRIDRQRNRLVAFNAESWKGGFDLPFLRTRCIANQHEWVLDGLQFADLWEPVKKRLNTTVSASTSSVDINTLDGSHQLLAREAVDGWAPLEESDVPVYSRYEYDPFADSAEAVTAYRKREFESVAAHNLADIHRTWELGELIREYISPKDISEKKL